MGLFDKGRRFGKKSRQERACGKLTVLLCEENNLNGRVLLLVLSKNSGRLKAGFLHDYF